MKQNVNKIHHKKFFLMQIKENGRQKAMFSSDNCQFWQLSYNIEGFFNQRKSPALSFRKCRRFKIYLYEVI